MKNSQLIITTHTVTDFYILTRILTAVAASNTTIKSVIKKGLICIIFNSRLGKCSTNGHNFVLHTKEKNNKNPMIQVVRNILEVQLAEKEEKT